MRNPGTSVTSKSTHAGCRKNAKSTVFCHPIRRPSGVSGTTSFESFLARFSNAANPCSAFTRGGSRGTRTRTSVTRSVRVGLWKKAYSR